VALVTRDEMHTVLSGWADRELSHQAVYDWATERFDLEQMDRGDPVINEILAHLDIMDVNVTTPDDVPVFLAMLDAASPELATELLRRAGDGIDLDERFAKWGSDPFYAPYCHRIGDPPPGRSA